MMLAPNPAAEGKERLSRAQSRKVMICTPIARDPTWQYLRSMVDTVLTLDRLGIVHRGQFVVGNSNLPRARNELVAEFLASGYTDLVFIDDDMGWKPDALVRLLASDKPLIGVVGRKRVDKPNTDPAVWCVSLCNSREVEQDDFGAVKVRRVGTGFVKISREVFEKIIAAKPELKRRGWASMSEAVRANYYKFFEFGDIDEDAEIGEDFLFCDMWRSLGGEVWIDAESELTHVGTKEYSGSICELMQPGDPQ